MTRLNGGKKPTALSLFSGGGGMDIGVLAAGFEVVACVEQDRHCVATLEENVRREGRGSRVYHRDVRTLNPQAIMRELEIRAEISVFVWWSALPTVL